MPVTTGMDDTGCFKRWGSSGTKFRFPCGDAGKRKEATAKAQAQGRAAKASSTPRDSPGTKSY